MNEPYHPIDVADLRCHARQSIARMQHAEEQAGLASPEGSGPCALVKTAILALECSTAESDLASHWLVVGEAIVMLDEALRQMLARGEAPA